MITPATPDKPDGSQLRLSKEDASMSLTIYSANQSPGWRIIDTARPQNEWDSPSRGTCTVAFERIVRVSGKLTIAVLFTPETCQNSVADRLSIRPLETWSR